MATRTPKKYLWRVVECVYYSLDVVAETQAEAEKIYYDNIDIAVNAQDACSDIEAYELKQKPVRHKKGVYNVS